MYRNPLPAAWLDSHKVALLKAEGEMVCARKQILEHLKVHILQRTKPSQPDISQETHSANNSFFLHITSWRGMITKVHKLA